MRCNGRSINTAQELTWSPLRVIISEPHRLSILCREKPLSSCLIFKETTTHSKTQRIKRKSQTYLADYLASTNLHLIINRACLVTELWTVGLRARTQPVPRDKSPRHTCLKSLSQHKKPQAMQATSKGTLLRCFTSGFSISRIPRSNGFIESYFNSGFRIHGLSLWCGSELKYNRQAVRSTTLS